MSMPPENYTVKHLIAELEEFPPTMPVLAPIPHYTGLAAPDAAPAQVCVDNIGRMWGSYDYTPEPPAPDCANHRHIKALIITP
jgi:hypothetical protein